MDPFELEDAVVANDVATVGSLLTDGHDPNSVLHGTDIPVVRLALDEGNESVVELLAEFGADIECVASDGSTLLHRAAMAVDGNPVVKSLVRLGADPNRQDHAGWTPLHRAVSLGYRSNVRWLVQSGAKPDVVTADGLTVVDIADVAGHFDIFAD